MTERHGISRANQDAAPHQSADSHRQLIDIRNILNTAMDGIISIDENQNILLFNAAAEEIFGYRADEIIGRSIELLIPSRFRASHRILVEQFGHGNTPSKRMGGQRTVMALRRSGDEFPIEASISQTCSQESRVYTVILRDVSEIVRHRQQIEQLLLMLEQVTEAIRVVDLDGKITFWNRGAQRLFGWTAEEVVGRVGDELLYPGDPKLLAQIHSDVKEKQSWAGEMTKTTKDGRSILVEHRRTVLRNEVGLIQGYLCIDIDITERRKRELIARRSQRLESIGTLAGGIAHDLNNVLTPILMGTKLLASGRVPSNRQGLLETMVASAERGASLIKQLLSFAGGIQGERRPVRISQVVSEVRGLLEHTFMKSIEIECRVDPNCPLVMGDTTELSQILTNLCTNARDAMPNGGTLLIEVETVTLNGNSSQLHPDAHPGQYVLLIVTDDGIGMTSQVLEKIFDPFFTTKEIGKGTGIGLAMVQGLVKNHGGFITVYSEPGRGSKFSIFLPAIQVAEPPEIVVVRHDDESGRGRTVLVVDDEPPILTMAGAALEVAGYRVLTASDGASALAVFSEHRDEIAVVLLDIMMPGIDGVQTMDMLKSMSPGIVIIASSGLRTSQREFDVLQHGARTFLPKPYSDDQLLKTIADALR